MPQDQSVARHPAGVDVGQAGAASLAGLTALAAHDALGLREGATVLVVGAFPSPENLERLAGLLDAGALRVPIQATHPLAEAGQALKALTTQHTQGKIAITLP